MSGSAFHHVAIKAHEWERSLHFYREVLAMAPRLGWGDSPTRIAWLEAADGTVIELFEDTDYRPQTPDTPDPGTVIQHFCFWVDDVAAAHAVAMSLGATPVLEPQDVEIELTTGPSPLRVHLCFFGGPSGEVIELIERNE